MDLIQTLPKIFKPETSKGINTVFQCEIEGEGEWFVIVKDETCQVHEGLHEEPGVTVTTDRETFEGVFRGKISGIEAFLSGRLRVSGNLMLAQRFLQMFLI